jgi:hypothetical protein
LATLSCTRPRFARIQKEAGIKEAAAAGEGVDDEDGHPAGLANLLDELLEGDFDPEAYDKRMAAAFDDAYYEVCVAAARLQKLLSAVQWSSEWRGWARACVTHAPACRPAKRKCSRHPMPLPSLTPGR